MVPAPFPSFAAERRRHACVTARVPVPCARTGLR